MKNSKRLLTLSLLLTGLTTACSTTKTIETSDDITCHIFCEVQYSKKLDSAVTIDQVRQNNAAYIAVCPPKPCIKNDNIK